MNCIYCQKETSNPKFCSSSCAATYNNKYRSRQKLHLCISCGRYTRKKQVQCRVCRTKKDRVIALNYTVGEIKELYKNKTTLALAAKIRGYGKTIYENSNKDKFCSNCGYYKHYEVCHIRAVKDFPDSATMKEVHALDNLIALCPNCHWEFDHGLLIPKG